MKNYLKSEKGFSLVYVLIISVTLTASILIVLTFIGIHTKTISTKENFLKAKYLAEGGFYKFIHSLSGKRLFDAFNKEVKTRVKKS
jgi:hypothetical protein